MVDERHETAADAETAAPNAPNADGADAMTQKN